jgi:hypothetical protein
VLYKTGKWQIGPVGHFDAQTTADCPGSHLRATNRKSPFAPWSVKTIVRSLSRPAGCKGGPMPAERAPMRKVREFLRLRHAPGVSERQIAITTGLSRPTFDGKRHGRGRAH